MSRMKGAGLHFDKYMTVSASLFSALPHCRPWQDRYFSQSPSLPGKTANTAESDGIFRWIAFVSCCLGKLECFCSIVRLAELLEQLETLQVGMLYCMLFYSCTLLKAFSSRTALKDYSDIEISVESDQDCLFIKCGRCFPRIFILHFYQTWFHLTKP